jgi:hypothetical protein
MGFIGKTNRLFERQSPKLVVQITYTQLWFFLHHSLFFTQGESSSNSTSQELLICVLCYLIVLLTNQKKGKITYW